MGILFHQARMLLDAHRRGVAMNRVLMIGHQTFLLHPKELARLRGLGARLADYRWGEYADRFFRESLGTEQLDVLDYSDFEGANLLHDLSVPIPERLAKQYDLVVEAGTLEHVFNFPVAIANLMHMTRVGGAIIASTVGNNLCGHGFYQFSPELIYRVFTEENGYRLGKVVAQEYQYPGVELAAATEAYEVEDPAKVASRVGLQTRGPVMLFFEAERIGDPEIFAKPPVQSDYAAAWAAGGVPPKSSVLGWMKSSPGWSKVRAWLRDRETLQVLQHRRIGRQQRKEFSFRNRRFFKKVQ